MSVEDELRVMVGAALALADEKEIKPETTWESLGADSLTIVELALQVEDRYGFQISTPDIKRLADGTFGTFVHYVEERTCLKS